nr:retrovirus-related Pol polyprotein from transposon TNT 1-94 [Tanacetum cinerariifolium]
AVTTACYTQNHSIIRKRHKKTPYELLHDRKLDLLYLHVFGALCYPKNESEDLGKMNARANVGNFVGYALAKKAYRIYNKRTRRIMETIQVDFDELIIMASDQCKLGPGLHEMTLVTHGAGLMSKHPSSVPFVPPTRTDCDILLQPLFDEYSLSPSHVNSTSAEEADHDNEVAHMGDNPEKRNPIPEPSSKESSSHNLKSINQPQEHITKWTKDHPINNVIQNLSREVSIRHQLQDKSLFCYFDAFLSSVEPKTYC